MAKVTPAILWRRHLKFLSPLEERFARDYRAVMADLRESIRTSGKTPFALAKWSDKAVEAMRPAYRAAILSGGRAFLTGTLSIRQKVAQGALSKAKKRTSDVVISLESMFEDRLRETIQTTYDSLAEILAEAVADKLDKDEVGDLIDEEWDDILGRRTDAIAITETNGAVNSVRDYLMLELVELQRWVTSQDERVRPTHVIYGDAGKKPVGFDWATLIPDVGYVLRFPCDPECHEPGEVINCRCFTVPEGELELSPADLKEYLADFEMDPEDLLRSEDQEPVYVTNRYTGKGWEEQARDENGRWSDGGTTVDENPDGDRVTAYRNIEAAAARTQLPPSSWGERPIRAPFKVVPEPEIDKSKPVRRGRVMLSELRASERQTDVFPQRVRHYVGGVNDRIYVIQTPDGFVIGDGLHRATAAFAEGDISIEADIAQAKKVKMKGDLVGHPFRGNQYTNGLPAKGDSVEAGGVRATFNPRLTSEARNLGDGRYEVGPKFFDLSDDATRAHVLRHEEGHDISDAMLRDGSAWAIVDDPEIMQGRDLNGQTTPGEVIAEAWAVLHDEPEWLRENFPKLYDIVDERRRGGASAKGASCAQRAALFPRPLPSVTLPHRLYLPVRDGVPECSKGWEEQPRDERGKWTAGGGSIAAGSGAAREGRDRRVDGDGAHLTAEGGPGVRVPEGSREVEPGVFEVPGGGTVYLPGAALPKWLTEPKEPPNPHETDDEGRARRRRNEVRDLYASTKKGVLKGDFEGHPFRGNQWTSGQGGGEKVGGIDRAEVEQALLPRRVAEWFKSGETGDPLGPDLSDPENRKWVEENPEEFRQMVDRWTAEGLRPNMDDWSNWGSSRINEMAEAIAKGEAPTFRELDQAASGFSDEASRFEAAWTMLNVLSDPKGPVDDGPLYRGMVVSASSPRQLPGVGGVIDDPVMSFTTSQRIGDGFAKGSMTGTFSGRHDPEKGEQGVLIKTEGPVHVLYPSGSKDREGKMGDIGEAEMISGGKFEVTKIETREDGVKVYTVRQVEQTPRPKPPWELLGDKKPAGSLRHKWQNTKKRRAEEKRRSMIDALHEAEDTGRKLTAEEEAFRREYLAGLGIKGVLKGDFEGHPFRGNQWTSGGGGKWVEDGAMSDGTPNISLTASKLKDMKKEFDPNQPRDSAGRWTDGGGGEDVEMEGEGEPPQTTDPASASYAYDETDPTAKMPRPPRMSDEDFKRLDDEFTSRTLAKESELASKFQKDADTKNALAKEAVDKADRYLGIANTARSEARMAVQDAVSAFTDEWHSGALRESLQAALSEAIKSGDTARVENLTRELDPNNKAFNDPQAFGRLVPVMMDYLDASELRAAAQEIRNDEGVARGFAGLPENVRVAIAQACERTADQKDADGVAADLSNEAYKLKVSADAAQTMADSTKSVSAGMVVDEMVAERGREAVVDFFGEKAMRDDTFYKAQMSEIKEEWQHIGGRGPAILRAASGAAFGLTEGVIFDSKLGRVVTDMEADYPGTSGTIIMQAGALRREWTETQDEIEAGFDFKVSGQGDAFGKSAALQIDETSQEWQEAQNQVEKLRIYDMKGGEIEANIMLVPELAKAWEEKGKAWAATPTGISHTKGQMPYYTEPAAAGMPRITARFDSLDDIYTALKDGVDEPTYQPSTGFAPEAITRLTGTTDPVEAYDKLRERAKLEDAQVNFRQAYNAASAAHAQGGVPAMDYLAQAEVQRTLETFDAMKAGEDDKPRQILRDQLENTFDTARKLQDRLFELDAKGMHPNYEDRMTLKQLWYSVAQKMSLAEDLASDNQEGLSMLIRAEAALSQQEGLSAARAKIGDAQVDSFNSAFAKWSEPYAKRAWAKYDDDGTFRDILDKVKPVSHEAILDEYTKSNGGTVGSGTVRVERGDWPVKLIRTVSADVSNYVPNYVESWASTHQSFGTETLEKKFAPDQVLVFQGSKNWYSGGAGSMGEREDEVMTLSQPPKWVREAKERFEKRQREGRERRLEPLRNQLRLLIQRMSRPSGHEGHISNDEYTRQRDALKRAVAATGLDWDTFVDQTGV